MSDKPTIKDYQRLFGSILEPEVIYAGEYLESRGFEFGKDFGTSDAVSVAAIIYIRERGL